MTLLGGNLCLVTRMSARRKSFISTVSTSCQSVGRMRVSTEKLSDLTLGPGKWLDGFFAETAQGEQGVIVSFRPRMTAVDADVILEPVGGGEDSSRQDTDVLRQSGAIEL
jgi:hypothetical protein